MKKKNNNNILTKLQLCELGHFSCLGVFLFGLNNIYGFPGNIEYKIMYNDI